AGITIDPPRAQKVAEIVTELAAELAAKGVTEEELERSKKPVLTSLRESARTNQYWLGAVLAKAQERPEALDWCRSRYTDNEAITVAEISELAKRYLGADRVSRVVVIPSGKTEAKPAASGTGAATPKQ
ncbi:MAG TPA: insulinase family protein, partial [Opitutaceae bacterium]